VILSQGEETIFEKDLAKEVLESIPVFSTRLQGSRSGKHQKLLATKKPLRNPS
jgi:predicted site-specific integrase-resolvase